ALRAAGGNDAALDVLALYADRPAAGHARWGAVWETWWLQHTHDRRGAAPWAIKPAGEWRVAPRALGFWEQWGVPQLASYDGMLLYRTTVTLSAQQAQQQPALSLGGVEEMEQTWINGKPGGTLHAGENFIVVNVLDTY